MRQYGHPFVFTAVRIGNCKLVDGGVVRISVHHRQRDGADIIGKQRAAAWRTVRRNRNALSIYFTS